MAFMMPVMKNNYDIYKCNRQRHPSESSSQRSRKVSETKSECAAARPAPLGAAPAHRSVPARLGTGSALAPGAPPPARARSCAPPAAPAPDKFHSRLLDKLKRSFLRRGRDGAPAGKDEERAS